MENLLAYIIDEIPDPFYPQYRMASGNDVLSAAGRNCEHVLRTVAHLPPMAATMAFRFVFDPKQKNEDKQSRMRIYVLARCE